MNGAKFARLVLALVITTSLNVSAATIESYCPTWFNGKPLPWCNLYLSGPIVAGDAEKLRGALGKPPASGAYFHTLVLDSPGGDVVEAMKIADIVRKAMLGTTNMNMSSGGFPCLSACVLVLASGVVRDVAGDRLIGMHRPYFASEAYSKGAPAKIAGGQSEMMRRMRAYLQGEGMASDLIDKMMRHSSRNVYWVSRMEWVEKVPRFAPWYEEMLIARCAYRHMEERRHLNDEDNRLEITRLAICVTGLSKEAQKMFARTEAKR